MARPKAPVISRDQPRTSYPGGASQLSTTDLSRVLQLGIAPDSWGEWFPEDTHQVTWRQYLDEIARARYVWTDLGPQGFLPTYLIQIRYEVENETETDARRILRAGEAFEIPTGHNARVIGVHGPEEAHLEVRRPADLTPNVACYTIPGWPDPFC